MSGAAGTVSLLPDRLPDSEWRGRPELMALCAILNSGPEGEVRARFVGGAVRDSLLGLAVKDIDIATVDRPETVIERLGTAGIKCVPTGIAHGTVTAVTGAGPVEITTLRRDVSTDGRRATVAFADDWREDAARRDFTMNALYADPASGAILDFFGGRADLLQGRVRFIGEPAARIDEDHLRILRYFRFLARFGTADRDAEDYAACVERAPTLMALSRERIADELLKLLAVADPVPALDLMVDGGIFRPVLPEVDRAGIQRVAALRSRESEMGLAPDGLRRFIALVPPDAAIADTLAARLKLSNKARLRIAQALGEPVAGDARALAFRLGPVAAEDRIALGRALAPDAVASLAGWTVPRFPVGGRDLIARGVTAGPAVARLLRAVEDQWVGAGFPGRDEALAMVDQLLSRERLSDQ